MAILDSDPPFTFRTRPRIEDEALFLSKALQAVAPADESDVFADPAQLERLESGEIYKDALERFKRWGLLDKDIVQETGEAYIRSFIRGRMGRIKTLGNYEAKIYPGKITLFRAQHVPKQEYGWSCLSTEPLSIREISGPHWLLMREPHVQILAEQLRDSIKEVTKRHSFAGSA